MPLALTPISNSQNLHTALLHADGGNAGGKPAETRARTDADSAPVGNDAPARDRITLSPANERADNAHVPAAPYAEIWKNGRKIAEIDSRGDVSVFDGMVAAHPAAGSGLTLAAQRAASIASSVGGEIRVGGMITDGATLTMKARLSEIYR